MTGSTWVDIIVIGIALLAAASGYRSGAVASALAFIGVALGAVAGLLLAPRLIEQFDDLQVRVLAGILVLVVLVVVGEVAGMVLGRAARGGIRSPGLRAVDSGVGSLLQVVAVLLAAGLACWRSRFASPPTRPSPGRFGTRRCSPGSTRCRRSGSTTSRTTSRRSWTVRDSRSSRSSAPRRRTSTLPIRRWPNCRW